ncbi:MAG: hypothetical protein OEV59_07635 [Deltaproteobacteria bacterium]|nr:hypothetical protein [Deltaproteobacteria bacterium]
MKKIIKTAAVVLLFCVIAAIWMTEPMLHFVYIQGYDFFPWQTLVWGLLVAAPLCYVMYEALRDWK